MSALAPTLEAFFTERLISQRQASDHTITAYRSTWRLLLRFAAERTAKQRFVLAHHWQRLGLALSPADFTDAEAIAAIARTTSGNFHLLARLFAQIQRVLDINRLHEHRRSRRRRPRDARHRPTLTRHRRTTSDQESRPTTLKITLRGAFSEAALATAAGVEDPQRSPPGGTS